MGHDDIVSNVGATVEDAMNLGPETIWWALACGLAGLLSGFVSQLSKRRLSLRMRVYNTLSGGVAGVVAYGILEGAIRSAALMLALGLLAGWAAPSLLERWVKQKLNGGLSDAQE